MKGLDPMKLVPTQNYQPPSGYAANNYAAMPAAVAVALAALSAATNPPYRAAARQLSTGKPNIACDAMLFGLWCGFIAAGMICILLLLLFGPDFLQEVAWKA
jgi:hypothetical protein